MVRFLHTADWQIGMKAAHVGEKAERVRDERLNAARRVVQVGREHSAEFIVVAGDTFEDNGVDRVLVQKVADILAEFDGPVYIIPGNHDPFVPGSVWDHPAWQRHTNLHVLTKAEPVSTDSVVLFPCPLSEKYSRRDPTRWIDASDADCIAIGLAHGSVEGIADDLDYPIPRDAADRSGLDYLALGHWHSTTLIPSPDEAVRLAYSGTHETTRFGERDSGNVLLVELSGRGSPPKLTPIRTGGLTWQVLERTVRSAEDLGRLRGEVEAVSAPDATLLDLRLTGVLQAAGRSELAQIEDIVGARFLYGRVDVSQLLPAPDDDAWIADLPPGLMRRVAERLKELAGADSGTDRPASAICQVAARALLELYRLNSEEQS